MPEARPLAWWRQCIVVATLACLVWPASADDRNGATWYRRAFERDGLSDADWAVLDGYWEDRGGPLPPQYRGAMSRARPTLDLLRRGATREYSDFGLDRSQGFELMLPHLASLRSLAKLMRHDIILHVHDGDAAGAADRVASLYEMGSHVQSDGVLISSLVGAAIFGLGEKTADLMLEHASLGPEQATRLLEGLDRFSGPDPFGMSHAIEGEREMISSWLGELPPEERATTLVDSLGWMDDGEGQEAVRGLSGEAFAQELADYDLLMIDVGEAFANEDSEVGRAQLAELSEAIAAGEHGLMAKLLAPSFEHVFDRMVEYEQKLADRRATLEGIVSGAIDPMTMANAAYLYAEAIRVWRAVPEDERRAVAVWMAADDAPVPEGVAETLASATPIVALVAEASALDRCDWSVLRHPWKWQWCPDSIGGVYELLGLLHATARTQWDHGEPHTAFSALAVAFGVEARHLAKDDRLPAAATSHVAFRQTLGLVETFDLARGEDAKLVFRTAVSKFMRGDPFGYSAAIAASRREVRGRLLARATAETGLEDRVRAASLRWDGDGLVHVLVAEETLASRKEPSPAPSGPGPLFGAVLHEEAYAAVLADVERIAEWLEASFVELFAEMPASPVVDIAARQRAARADYARARTLVGAGGR